jgi:hypothetical protein
MKRSGFTRRDKRKRRKKQQMDTSGMEFGKPGTRTKPAIMDVEVRKNVRAEVMRRDTSCRFPRESRSFWPCDVMRPREWAHRTGWRRARTAGKPPEERHQTQGSFALCGSHHDAYDEFQIQEEAVDPGRGADGPLRWYTADGEFLGES